MSKAEITRQFIIEKTAPIFNTKGYAGTSINDLTNATGLTKGSIYGNFENKDEVALAAFDYNYQRVAMYIKGEMEKRDSVIDKLLVYPETYRNYMRFAFLSNGCPVANASTDADDTHVELKNKAASALNYWRSSIERHLKAGIENREIKSNTNVNEVVAVITGLIQAGILQAKVSGKMNYLNASMDFVEGVIIGLKR